MGIAFKNAGYEIAGAWDFDKYAVESYRANVGDHVQKADIKELHQADIPQADVWAFGFPCQDLSVAGKQRGMILKCEDCGEEIEINPEEYTGNTICPKCSSNNFKAASRSGCFFEMMRLLEETEREREHAMPAVIIAENVRGLRPYLPVLRLEYERHGYTAHIEMFNSKYWNVPQNRDRYAVVGTRNKKNLSLHFQKSNTNLYRNYRITWKKMCRKILLAGRKGTNHYSPGNGEIRENGKVPCVHYAGPYQQAAERTEGKGRGRANVYTYRPGFTRRYHPGR